MCKAVIGTSVRGEMLTATFANPFDPMLVGVVMAAPGNMYARQQLVISDLLSGYDRGGLKALLKEMHALVTMNVLVVPSDTQVQFYARDTLSDDSRFILEACLERYGFQQHGIEHVARRQ